MKPLIPILIVATTSLAVASVQFARQASAQRERADAEMVLRQKQDTRIADLERSQARLQRELALAQADSGDAPRVAAAVPERGPPPPPRPNARLGGAFASLEPAQPGPPRSEFFGPRMESPAARNFMRTRLKGSLKRMYEDVGPALGLSQEKAGQLLDLLADQQSRSLGRPPTTEDGQPVQDMQKYFRDQQLKNNAEINALIGQDKVDEWTAYQKSLPDRAQLNQVREQLDTAGVPMTDSQRTEMLTALSEERDRLPRPTYAAAIPPEEMATQYKQWQTDYDKAVTDRAKQVLTSEQFKSYKEYQDWQAEMRNGMPMLMPGGRAMRNGIVAVPVESSGATVVSGAFYSVAPAPAPPEPERK
jgi:hypothetical protein